MGEEAGGTVVRRAQGNGCAVGNNPYGAAIGEVIARGLRTSTERFSE
jgi:hypothetical protein